MAEALAPVPDPVLTSLRPGPWVSAADAARAVARELLPDEAPAIPPPWLLPGQVGSLRRVVAALRRYSGALLADPVGSGKTYVALAAAREISSRRGTVCLAPAALLPQWQDTARRLALEITLLSHEQVSRGRLPDQRPGLVLIDEAHRFRNPRTRRYRVLAPWLVGRTVLLVTATPVVNRLDDLLHQLLLGVRDDALLPDGVSSLRGLLRGGAGSPALGRLVIERVSSEARPERADAVSEPTTEECLAAEAALAMLDGLALSRSGPIASLVRTVLRHAAASSPPALLAALRRYRRLLLHARDARAAGRPMDRAAIRRFTGETGDQLVMWELFPVEGSPSELDTADLEPLDDIIASAERWSAGPDAKARRLASLLADGVPSLVFVTRRETVRHLRDRLGDRGIAWCTGERAGLGHVTRPRATVLGWFREGQDRGGVALAALHLIVTDVAAEGLDLQRAGRVVHYDLPWTPMRLDQRDGRALRLGSRHQSVTVVRFGLPPLLERSLRIEAALRRKRSLPAAVGIGPAGRRLWRWRTELAESFGSAHATPGVAIVPFGPAGVLAGFGLHAPVGGRETRLAFVLGWLDDEGGWSEDEAIVAERLAAATRCDAVTRADPDGLRRALARLAEPVRARVAAARERRWATGGCEGAARIVAGQLQQAVRAAARRRDAAALLTLERAIGFVAGGHTAGEAMLMEQMAGESGAEIGRLAGRLPAPSARWGPVEARLAGILLFAPR
ncbi:MAG TPA: DEAD/DEAH box helicase [Gemmatimonadales bacterium]|nr:DEAD/DEAH box helicase [Gemmatimonadales bacterium]